MKLKLKSPGQTGLKLPKTGEPTTTEETAQTIRKDPLWARKISKSWHNPGWQASEKPEIRVKGMERLEAAKMKGPGLKDAFQEDMPKESLNFDDFEPDEGALVGNLYASARTHPYEKTNLYSYPSKSWPTLQMKQSKKTSNSSKNALFSGSSQGKSAKTQNNIISGQTGAKKPSPRPNSSTIQGQMESGLCSKDKGENRAANGSGKGEKPTGARAKMQVTGAKSSLYGARLGVVKN